MGKRRRSTKRATRGRWRTRRRSGRHRVRAQPRPPRPLRDLARGGERRGGRQPHVAPHRAPRLLAAARGAGRHPPLPRHPRRRPLARGRRRPPRRRRGGKRPRLTAAQMVDSLPAPGHRLARENLTVDAPQIRASHRHGPRHTGRYVGSGSAGRAVLWIQSPWMNRRGLELGAPAQAELRHNQEGSGRKSR